MSMPPDWEEADAVDAAERDAADAAEQGDFFDAPDTGCGRDYDDLDSSWGTSDCDYDWDDAAAIEQGS